ncbi:MAG: bifunctional 4-hydroxy-3-methylbut-2-enyl diphosphate reductase/30S ribosomal protein S1 [Clostridiales bacterium]|nr:MAG: bifunctional 4-hydroxy-3-methylbut-2-enyl diphosphate reductase/30S ribosomal protein S1 [Clostridiales bacterium]
MSFEVIKTQNIGFCFGVNRAVNALNEVLKNDDGSKKIYTFGQIVHNNIITDELEKKGVINTENIEDIEPGSIVFIRAHGIPRSVYEALVNKNVEIFDETCPKVKKIHNIVSNAENVIIAGNIKHPEVIGIIGNTKNKKFIVKDIDELKKIMHNISGIDSEIVFLAQTTFNASEFNEMAKYLEQFNNVRVVNTICSSTYERQKDVEDLAKRVDAFVIVGGKNSSNTQKLYEIASLYCKAFHIESPNELPNLVNYKKIGLSAGASTHSSTIEEVFNNMISENSENISLEEEEIDFAKAIEASMKIIRNGERVKGIITAVNGSEIQVDLGVKHSGFIPSDEFSNEENPPKVGDEVEAFVVRVNDVEGTAQLSKSKIDSIKGLEKIVAAKDSGDTLKCKVIEAVKGGIVVLVNKVRVFVPASLASLRRDTDLNTLVNKEFPIRIIEVDESGRRMRIIGSIRAVLKEELDSAQKQIWENIEIGKRYKGVVKSIVKFGVFVDIGGVDGLVHITDLTWGRIKSPEELVKVGDVIEVEVKAIDAEKRKISLVYKKSEDNPWEILKAKYKVDDVLDVTVLKIMPYGAFVSVVDNVDGLIHISQLSNHRVENVSEVLKVGDVVKAQIIEINYEEKRVSLSIRALLSEEEPLIVEATADADAVPSVEGLANEESADGVQIAE